MTSAVLHASLLMPFLTEDQCKVVVAAYVLFNTLCGLHLSRVFLRFSAYLQIFAPKTLTLTFWQSLGFPLQSVLREVDM